jgi:hypothetical protein
MLTSDELDTVCDVLVEHEGLVPWLYCDSLGYVTVGVGDKVSERSCLTMPFVHMANSNHATSDEKLAAYARVRAFFQPQPPLTASAYTAISDLRLPLDYCRRRLKMRVENEFVPAVAKYCPRFASFPLAAKLVLVDICYNVGTAGFAKFVALIACCNSMRFAAAAECVHTQKQGEDPKDIHTWGKRNTWRCNTMLQAAEDYANSKQALV